MILAALFVLAAVLLWPLGQHPPFWSHSHARPQIHAAVDAGAFPGAGWWSRVRDLGRREVRWGRTIRGGSGGLDQLLDLLAVGLEAGLPLAAAMEVLDGLGLPPSQQEALQHVRAVATDMAHPPPMGDVADTDLAPVLAATQLSVRTGAPLSDALRLAAAVVRDERDVRERREVLLAGPRMSMAVLTALPLLGPPACILLGWNPLSRGWPAMAAIIAGLVCTAAGWLWSRAMVRRAGAPTHVEIDLSRSTARATVLDVARAVDLMPLALLSGCGATEALEQVSEVVHGRVRADLLVAVAARRWGVQAGREWDLAGPAWAEIGASWRTADRAGAAPAGLLTAAATRMRRAEASRVETRIQRAGVLLVLPLGLCFLPGFLLTTVLPVIADLIRGVA